MQKYIIWITIAFVLTGCFSDPFAMTQRTQIRANADVAIAQAQKEAVIGAAEADASKAQAWAGVAPLLVALAMAGVVAIVVVYWQGKIYYARATNQATQTLTISSEYDLKLYARQLGGRLAIDDQGYKVYLPGGQVQRLIPTSGGHNELV